MLTSNPTGNKTRTGVDLRCPEDSFVVPEWFCDQVHWVQSPGKSNSFAYNLPFCVRIRGPLCHDALRRSLEQLQQRHQVLRSVFAVRNDRLVQSVLPPQEFSLAVTNLKEHADEELLSALAIREALQGFDLANEFAFRARLLRYQPDEHMLVITTHHLVCDDWSTGILLRELFASYETNAKAPPAPSFQYADFIRWQEKQLSAKAIVAGLDFWKQRLAGRNHFHYVQPNHARPRRRRYRGRVHREILPEALAKAVSALSRQERVSAFMVLLAGWQCVLRQCSGQDDIAVGSCAANRLLTEVEPLIGRFANDLVIRTDLSGNPTFRELLARVRKDSLAAYSQQLPFAMVAEHLDPLPHPDRNRLFQVMFILRDAPRGELKSGDLGLESVPLDTGTAKYDLCLFLSVNQSIEVMLEYDSDLFEPATITRLARQYRATLERAVRNPQEAIRGTEALPVQASAESCRTLAPPPAAAARDKVQATLVDIWETGFNRRPVSIDDDFFELGGDSLLAARLFARVGQEFDVRIPVVALVRAPTIRQLAPMIGEYKSSRESNCVLPIQTGGSRPPLFCAHGQSGNLLMYRTLAQHLGSDQPVYGIQPRGLDGKATLLTQLEEMAATYVDEVRTVQAHGPYFLAGYCMGGNIAFEMAQQLHARGEPVGLVALLDSFNVEHLKETALGEAYFAVQKLWFGWRHLLSAHTKNKMDFLHRRVGGIREPATEMSECNRRAALSYVPKQYPGRLLQVCPAHQYAKYLRQELSWEHLAAEGVEVFSLPIYPGQMFEEPFVGQLAKKLRWAMDEWQQSSTAVTWSSRSC